MRTSNFSFGTRNTSRTKKKNASVGTDSGGSGFCLWFSQFSLKKWPNLLEWSLDLQLGVAPVNQTSMIFYEESM